MTFVGSTDSSSLTGEYVSSDTARQKPPEEVREWLSGGLKAFEDWWGYRATVTAVPHHFAADSIVSAFGLEGLSMEYLVNQRSPFDNEEHGASFPNVLFSLPFCCRHFMSSPSRGVPFLCKLTSSLSLKLGALYSAFGH